MSKLLFLVAEDSYFCSHRLSLAKTAIAKGFQVAVATRCKQHKEIIEQAGIQVFPLKFFNRSGLNPWRQLLTLRELAEIYKRYQPDIVHHVAVKPVLLGSVVARWHKVPKVINALGGLGYLFTEPKSSRLYTSHTSNASDASKSKNLYPKKLKKTILVALVCKFYQWAFSQPNSILLLQNSDDKKLLLERGCVKENKLTIIPGSGIDVDAYPVVSPPTTPPVVICCVSRMLWDKGIGELVAAAKMLHAQQIPIKVLLYGMPDPENPASIPRETLEDWHASGIVEWRKYCNDVATAYAECHIAVLPSYREGLPKSLLEAASCGRPIVTTDVPGCREVVKDQDNGLLVMVENAIDLAEKLGILVKDEPLRIKMGLAGRKHIETCFSNERIHSKVLALY